VAIHRQCDIDDLYLVGLDLPVEFIQTAEDLAIGFMCFLGNEAKQLQSCPGHGSDVFRQVLATLAGTHDDG